MKRGVYRADRHTKSGVRGLIFGFAAIVLVIAGGFAAYTLKGRTPDTAEQAASQLQFDSGVTAAERQAIGEAMRKQSVRTTGSVRVHVTAALEASRPGSVLAAYVPVTSVYSTRLAITKAELGGMTVYVSKDMSDGTRAALAGALDLEKAKLTALSSSVQDIPDTEVAFVPVSDLSANVRLLAFDGAYYLDSFQKGAVFRQAEFEGNSASDLQHLVLNSYPAKDTILKVNMTGVTALTRVMMKKLSSVKDPTYFSQQIGAFLADADITHVSNEVSFKTGCQYSDTVFCAPPEMIETLKASGVDLVELTGNHNNDSGNVYNTESIKLYQSLGWHTFGGGLNTTEAAKPYVADQKGSKVAFLGYNYADAVGSGAVATSTTAGANHFDVDKIKADIAAAKQQSAFVIVDIQFWECYAYPPGFTEFPECDLPISNQKAVFRQVADLGADMVIGTQAHQPQTYELYHGKPVYYGLGNLYFEQTQWPGTERGIILTHYFVGGKLLQTKLSPTVYDKAFQTHHTTSGDATALLERLNAARQSAGL